MTRVASALRLLAPLILLTAMAGCGATTRAAVHEEDFGKVFPWPNSKAEVTIRVKPRTTLARSCFLLGSFEEVQVTANTTFYVVDEMGKKFAYTPSRSPIRRLAPVDSMEIRWPMPKAGPGPEAEAEAEAEEKGAGDAGAPAEDGPAKTPAQAPPAPSKESEAH